jgi:hypothetical protein
MMRPPDNEPDSEEIETLLDDEDRRVLDRPDVPDDVKSEITERLERWREEELEDEIPDGPPPDDHRY